MWGCEDWQLTRHYNAKFLATKMDFWKRSARRSRL